MIIALISDIHGNLPALKTVIDDAVRTKTEQIWCLGDFVGYLPFPNECIDLIRKKASASVVGNYDQKVIGFKQKKSEWKKSKKPPKFDAFQWNSRHLNSLSQKYLTSLPQNIRLKINNFKILLTHGSPKHIDEPILPETPRERMIELGKIADADIIVTGHTHRFMNRKIGNQWFINPGSIGLPVNKDLRAAYALLDISQKKIKVTQRKVEYDIPYVIKGLQEAKLSDTLKKMVKLEYGIDLKNYLHPSSAEEKISSNSQRILKAVRKCAGEYDYEKKHSVQVTSLALNLFDELIPLHKLKNADRLLLNCAALLHDIGWIEGQKSHHKTSMELILDQQTFPFTDNQQRMIALIARYHRKALPKDSHPIFSQLSVKDKYKVRILAGILRIADGLDRTHTCATKSIECDFTENHLTVKCRAPGPSTFEIEAATKKSNLLRQVLDKDIRFVVIRSR